MKATRILEVVAMTMIGDGVLALVGPCRHAALWRGRSRRWNRMLDTFIERPQLTRAVGALEAAAGVALASWQWRTAKL